MVCTVVGIDLICTMLGVKVICSTIGDNVVDLNVVCKAVVFPEIANNIIYMMILPQHSKRVLIGFQLIFI